MHDTIRILTEGRGASSMINLCRTATPPTTRDLRQIIRRCRRLSKTYQDCMIRELILRMSHSRSHSSRFLTRAFAKTGKPSHFYAALVAHAQGDPALARTELANTTVRDFEGVDLLFLWSLTESLGFFAAELTLAAHIPQVQPQNTWACLHAVKTLTRAGHLQTAEAELARASRNPDAAEHASYFTEFSQLIRQGGTANAASAA
jgi:hypothetical protein